MSKLNDKKLRKTGRTSPAWSLPSAIEFAGKVKESLGNSPASGDLIAQSLGHPSFRNGAANMKIGSLTHFGLLQRGKGTYKLSELAMRILVHTDLSDKCQATAQAAKTPSLYQDLVVRFADQALPSLLPNILAREFNVVEGKAKGVDELFRETMEYAGLLRNGVLHSEPEQDSRESETVDSSPSTEAEVGVPVAQSTQDVDAPEVISMGAFKEYQFLLPNQRSGYIKLPTNLSDSDLDQITSWLEFSRGLLVNKEAVGADTDG